MIAWVALLFSLLVAGDSLFVSVDDADRLLAGGASVLDARPRKAFNQGHLPGAVSIDWKDFRDGWGRTGRLEDDDAALARKLGALGIADDRAVLVYGAAESGWGEEGRIAWMLSYLGKQEVHVLDGGYEVWRLSARKVDVGAGRSPLRSTFTPRRNEKQRTELPGVVAATHSPSIVILDVRTGAEWTGATPYWEARGGHIPGARHLEWKSVLDAKGRLLPAPVLIARLGALGVGPTMPIIVYCTGGVRSAFVWVALRAAGFTDVRNFDGSFWSWARHRELAVVVGDPP